MFRRCNGESRPLLGNPPTLTTTFLWLRQPDRRVDACVAPVVAVAGVPLKAIVLESLRCPKIGTSNRYARACRALCQLRVERVGPRTVVAVATFE